MLNVKAPESIVLKPVITVFGIGGGGGNAVNNMISAKLQGARFVVANTDAQALEDSLCENKIQLGANKTRGLGAGAEPAVGKEAAEESAEEIKSFLEGSNMVFITAGMGGGTGTGASPVIARLAKEMGILTVGVVTKPFNFEGQHRIKTAEQGILDLQHFVDTLIIIPNQNLFRIANQNTTFANAFEMADGVLYAGVRGVTDLIIMPGLINLDFADIRTIMSKMGKAIMGTGDASGEDRAIKAAEGAIFNPLLDHNSMKGARGVLINITGGADMTLFEVDSAANRIREEVGDVDANIIFGSTLDTSLQGVIRVSVIATGIEADEMVLNCSKEQQQDRPFYQNNLNGNNIELNNQQHFAGAEASSNNFATNSYEANKQFFNPLEQEINNSQQISEEYLAASLANKLAAEQAAQEASSFSEEAEEARYLRSASYHNNQAAKHHLNEERIANINGQETSKPPSLLSRMWNSLKTQNNNHYSEHRSQTSRDHRNLPEEGNSFYDIPTYLRNKK